MVTWDTDVSVIPCKAKFKKFVETWVDPYPDVNIKGPTYMQRLEEISKLENPFMDVHYSHIQNFDTDLYSQLICYPRKVIPIFDMAVNEMFFERFPDTTLAHQIKVRPYSADKTRDMRTLGHDDINQLITITGIVTQVIPEATVTTELERGRIHEPTMCNRTRFSDKPMMKLQESSDYIPAGQTPRTVVMYVHDDVVDDVYPGDRVSVTGVYRAIPKCVSPIVRNMRTVYNTHIEVVHISKKPDSSLKIQFDGNQTLVEQLLQFGHHFKGEDNSGSDVPVFSDGFLIPQVDGGDEVPVENAAVEDLAVEPRGQPLPINRQLKQKSVKDNHFYEVKRLFFVRNTMMVELDITFFRVEADPERHLKKHNVVIPYEEIENCKIKNELQNRLVGKAIFIKDIYKYTRQLLADIQSADESVKKTGTKIKEAFRFEFPSLFAVDGIVYYCSGIDSLWRLSRPTKKLEEDDRKKLNFVVFYSGENKEFVDSEETLVRGIFKIVEWFNKQQPNTRDHGWVWVYMARVVQGKLYLPLVKRYPQTTTVVTSGKQTRCAKSLAGSTFNLISNGKDEKGGKFKEAQVFKKIIAGEEYIVDEMTSLPPPLKKDFVTVVQHNFQRLYRAVGSGGFPNAVMFVHCNIEPNDFNFDECDRSKMCFIDVGRTQTGQVKGEKEKPKDLHKKIIATAGDLHLHYPNLLAIGTECFFDPITDDEMKTIEVIVQDDDRKGQDVVNALKFFNKMKELGVKYKIEPPNSLKSDPDIRCMTEAFTRQKCVEDLLNWVDDQDLLEDCELATCNGIEGVKIPSSAVSLTDAPGDLQPIISACPCPSINGRRWRFVAFHDLTAGMVEKVQMATLSTCSLWCEEAKRYKKEEQYFMKELIAAAGGRIQQQDVVDEDLDKDVNSAGSSTGRSSTAVSNFTCDVCGKSCKSAGGMKVHMKVHKAK